MKTHMLIALLFLALTGCSSMPRLSLPQSTTETAFSGSLAQMNDPAFWQGNAASIWKRLQYIPRSQLEAAQATLGNTDKSAWVQLALISKRYSLNTSQLVQELIAWRNQHSSHPGATLFPDNATLSHLAAVTPQHIALLLPLTGNLASSGQAVRDGFLSAYYSGEKRMLSFYDTSQTTSMPALYQQAIAKGADFVIGPLTKSEVQQLSSVGTFPVPTLALNYTTVYFGSLPTNFYEYGLAPEDESEQIADKAKQAGLSHALIIAPQTPWGQRTASAFISRWRALGGSIQDTWYFRPRITDFNQEVAHLLQVDPQADRKLMQKDNNKTTLEKQRRRDFDVIFLFAQPEFARAIVPLLRYYYADNIPVYATSAVYTGQPNPAKDMDLNGVTVCDLPWTLQAKGDNRLYALGRDAYLISQSFTRLTQLPQFPLYGATGALTLTSKQQIHRRLPCNTVRAGMI